MSSTYGVADTQYGFVWGPASITRACSDPKWGVIIDVTTPRQVLTVRVTPSGLIRVTAPVKRDDQ